MRERIARIVEIIGWIPAFIGMRMAEWIRGKPGEINTTERRSLWCRLFCGCCRKPARPEAPAISSIKESLVLRYTITAPPLGAPDVVSRKVTTEINGQATEADFPVNQTELVRDFNDNDVVKIFFTDTDDAGNVSPPGVALEFTAVDTIPPSAPGAPTVTNVEEI